MLGRLSQRNFEVDRRLPVKCSVTGFGFTMLTIEMTVESDKDNVRIMVDCFPEPVLPVTLAEVYRIDQVMDVLRREEIISARAYTAYLSRRRDWISG